MAIQGILIVADAIRVHPDQTWSVLRGGITNLHAARTEPIQFRGSVFARITGDIGDIGQHRFELRFINADGERIVPDVTGEFNLSRQALIGNIAADLALVLPAYGTYTFVLRVDAVEVCRWQLTAAERPAATGGPA